MGRFVDVANLLTLGSLLTGFAVVLLAVEQRPAHALVGLVFAGLADLFDGWLARRLKRTDDQQRFGARLDSLADACNFGLAPAVLLYCFGLDSPPEIALESGLLLAAVWRLAYFDTVRQVDQPLRYYEGLPTTYVALVLPTAFLIGAALPGALRVSLWAATAGLIVAMLSPWKIPKPRGLAYIVFLVLAVASVVVFLSLGNSYVPPIRR